MCEFSQVFKNSMPQYQEWIEGVNVPNDRFFKSVLSSVKQGVCPTCGTRLSYEDMHPVNARCTRSLCDPCYRKIFASHINTHCPACGLALPSSKVRKQLQGLSSMREVRNHLHEECVSRWAFMHANVIGHPPEAIQVLDVLCSIFLIDKGYQKLSEPNSNDHIIDAEFVSMPPRSITSGMKALNSPSIKPFSVEHLFSKDKKDDVVYIPLPRNKI